MHQLPRLEAPACQQDIVVVVVVIAVAAVVVIAVAVVVVVVVAVAVAAVAAVAAAVAAVAVFQEPFLTIVRLLWSSCLLQFLFCVMVHAMP